MSLTEEPPAEFRLRLLLFRGGGARPGVQQKERNARQEETENVRVHSGKNDGETGNHYSGEFYLDFIPVLSCHLHPSSPHASKPGTPALALLVVFLYREAEQGGSLGKIGDLAFFAGIAFLFYYFIWESPRLTTRVAFISDVLAIDIVAMAVCVVVLMEAVRRTMGKILFFFILFFIFYAWFGHHFPSILRYRGTNLETFTELMTMGPDGILGTPLYTSANSLFYFIVFGSSSPPAAAASSLSTSG
jgi:TRAP-type uncharacterized transport system fused permease subunit